MKKALLAFISLWPAAFLAQNEDAAAPDDVVNSNDIPSESASAQEYEDAEGNDDDSEFDPDDGESESNEVDSNHTNDLISHDDMMKLHSAFDYDGDGKVSMSEVLKFASTLHKEAAKKNVDSSLKQLDTSGDGQLSLEEVLAGVDMQSNEEEQEVHERDPAAKEKWQMEAEARKQFEIEKFQAADVDSDGVLTKEELSHFFHPGTHHESLKLMALDTLKRRDKDGNGKLSESEFLQLQDDDEEALQEHEWTEGHKEEFRKLDKDGDGHLDVHELMPWESGMSHVEHAMTRLFEHADTDKDGHVSAKELAEAREKIRGSDAHHYLTEWTAHSDL
eukprot:gnl/MRDRNA2_/MRDRNA2_73293_c0_seq1.p1 gnl/MRDRNA2_/MRDRNA2_73293_c0~~gnl/MRDRNA2_/MRDRNA2_73293_c0_seq1.p1  ORF type:complete len:333 (+),score=108.92 gnl/MRDRNA2_/MRDRNA2_73293_c0_seq1:107-1105(+)